MGILGGLKNCGAVLFGGMKKVAGGTANSGKAVGKALARGVKGFTGQTKFEDAKRRLDALQNRAKKLQEDFDKEAERLHKETCQHLEVIDDFRLKLQNHDFERFILLTEVFSHWTIQDISIQEIARKSTTKVAKLRDREELFKIDFDRNPIASNLKALLTFGFWSRKQVDSTLKNVQEEECKLDMEAEKLNGELTRLKKVCEALKQVTTYFECLHGSYTRLLDELEYAVHYVRSAYLLQDTQFFNGTFDVYYLPKRHLLCLMAAEKLTRILYEMGSRKYLSSSLVLEEEDMEAAKRDFESYAETEQRLAA